MSPEFDPRKNAANIAKHGVSLATGDGVLNDPLAITIEDSSALDEQRWVTVGANSLGTLMVVVWTERGEEIRLISVRPATSKERKSYQKGNEVLLFRPGERHALQSTWMMKSLLASG